MRQAPPWAGTREPCVCIAATSAVLRHRLLIELTHTPLALSGVAAGWARWLELRLPGRGGRIAGWVWPVCFLFVGIILLWYREA